MKTQMSTFIKAVMGLNFVVTELGDDKAFVVRTVLADENRVKCAINLAEELGFEVYDKNIHFSFFIRPKSVTLEEKLAVVIPNNVYILYKIEPYDMMEVYYYRNYKGQVIQVSHQYNDWFSLSMGKGMCEPTLISGVYPGSNCIEFAKLKFIELKFPDVETLNGILRKACPHGTSVTVDKDRICIHACSNMQKYCGIMGLSLVDTNGPYFVYKVNGL